MNITEVAKELCEDHDVQLLYLSLFGSHLYGTDTPESDKDYKGIFLPSKRRCLLGQNIKHITRNSGDAVSKNTKEDIDLQLWSLQYFLEMVGKGETNALDLLYSGFSENTIVYMDRRMPLLFNRHNTLFDVKKCNAYVGYAIGQAKKYGIKGSRLGKIKDVHKYIADKEFEKGSRLSFVLDEILEKFHDPSYCFEKTFNGIPGLVLCGKVHLAAITIEEFKQRISEDYQKYGERAVLAEQSKGIDWKAMSHAVRSLVQMESLIETGAIVYPLKEADMLKQIKAGKIDFQTLEILISHKIAKIDHQLNNLKHPLNVKDIGYINALILNFYGM